MVIRISVIIILIGLFVCSCGLFNSRPSEYPEPSIEVKDVYNFNRILLFDGKFFSKQNYETFFDDTLVYVDGLNFSVKPELMTHLKAVISSYDSIWVDWGIDSSQNENLDEKIINVIYRTYIVHVLPLPDTTLGIIPDSSKTFSGKCYFSVAYDELQGWQILRWVDEPAGGLSYSFFDPQFKDY
jgi:hypothetical protein